MEAWQDGDRLKLCKIELGHTQSERGSGAILSSIQAWTSEELNLSLLVTLNRDFLE